MTLPSRSSAALAEQKIRQQQFRVIVNFLEQSGEYFIQGVALGNQEIFEKLLSQIGFFQRENLALVQPVKLQMNRFGQHLRLEFALIIREHTHMRRQVAVDFHESQRGKAVEPSESHFFHDLLKSLRVHLANERLTLTLFRHRQNRPVHAVVVRVAVILVGNSIHSRAVRNAVNQFIPRPDCVFFDCVFVHVILPFYFV